MLNISDVRRGSPPKCAHVHLGKWHPLPQMKREYDETRLPGEGARPGDGTVMAAGAGREVGFTGVDPTAKIGGSGSAGENRWDWVRGRK